MQEHAKSISVCLLTALFTGFVTQLMSIGGFIRWSAVKGNDYSSEFWNLVISSWTEDGLTTFLIWSVVSLVVYFTLHRLTKERKTAEKVIVRLSIILAVLYGIFMYPNFRDYL
ncbi:hypothetical protein ACFSKO_19280 [Kiloniella antarctica]|uniref:Uncharacterized protein n=1 Tax=Kiloniella antarctica TaxID=1550907 RepID=A0ABW5BNS2_9PROT